MRIVPIIVGLLSGAAALLVAGRISSEMPQRVEVDGGSMLRMLVEGNRGPVIVLEMETNERLRARLAKFARVVDYHRAGWGDSMASGSKRDASQIAQELHTALGKCRVDPPYILVGDTRGSLFVRRFAQMFPREVAGLILIDPMVEEEAPHATVDWLKTNRPDTYKQFQDTIQENASQAGFSFEWIRYLHAVERKNFEQILEKATPEQRAPWKEIVNRRVYTDESSRMIYSYIKESPVAELNEGLAFEDTFQQLRGGGPLPSVPIKVITGVTVGAGETPDQASFNRAENEYIRQKHAKLLTNAANAEYLTWDKTQSDQPDILAGLLEKMAKKTALERR